MKKHVRLASSLVVLAALLTPRVSTAETTSAMDLIPFPSRPFVEQGMARDTVSHMLGEPEATLSRNVWVYFDFRAANPRFRYVKTMPANPEKLDTLVIEFANDRVSRIRLCDGRPVREFLAHRESNKSIAPVLAAR